MERAKEVRRRRAGHLCALDCVPDRVRYGHPELARATAATGRPSSGAIPEHSPRRQLNVPPGSKATSPVMAAEVGATLARWLGRSGSLTREDQARRRGGLAAHLSVLRRDRRSWRDVRLPAGPVARGGAFVVDGGATG